MQNKRYIAPQCALVKLYAESPILSGSDGAFTLNNQEVDSEQYASGRDLDHEWEEE